MLRFVESFDWWGSATNPNLGALGGPSQLKYTFTDPFSGFRAAPGRYGGNAGAMNIIISQPTLTKQLDAQPQWAATFAFQPHNAFGLSGWGNGIFARLDASTAPGVPVLSVVIDNAGYMRFYTGGNGGTNRGTLIATAPWLFALDVWAAVDITVDIPGRRLECWVNDVQQLVVVGIVWAHGPAVYPDTWAWTWWPAGGNNNRGYVVDDFGLADGQGPLNNGRLGPCRAVLVLPNSDATEPQWTRHATAGGGAFLAPPTADYQCIDDANPSIGYPDGDQSYIETAMAGAIDLFGVPGPNCFGRNLGLAANACLKAPGVPAPVDLICRADPTIATVTQIGGSVPAILGAKYATQQRVSESSILRPGQVWTDGEIGNAWWGLRCPGPGFPRVTQFFLEKLTSTRVQPFDCGQIGSYSF
ncbi:MAG: hypothetical protein EPO08_20725 [Rhodospirillaceae bacterium]|nr:MAG: hypothetical protein EPO08_20725 [Rhodospirillaceae bacterium]